MHLRPAPTTSACGRRSAWVRGRSSSRSTSTSKSSPTTPSATFTAFHLAGSSCEASYGLGAFDGKTLGGTRNRDVMLRPYTDGEWQHLTTQITKSTSSSTGYREVTTYAGIPLVDRDAHASNGAAPTDCTNDDLVLGVTETGTTPVNVIVLFDNVLVRKLE